MASEKVNMVTHDWTAMALNPDLKLSAIASAIKLHHKLCGGDAGTINIGGRKINAVWRPNNKTKKKQKKNKKTENKRKVCILQICRLCVAMVALLGSMVTLCSI